MHKLFICERPFILYKSILKAVLNNEDIIDIILSDHMPEMKKLYLPLKESGIFRNVYYFHDEYYQDYVKNEHISDFVKFPAIIWAWPKKLIRYFLYQTKANNIILPKEIDFAKYDEIITNDGVSAINFHLYRHGINHVVSEHARNNFQIKVGWHILAVRIMKIMDWLGLIPAYSGVSKYVTAVEVSENKNIVQYLKNKNIRVFHIGEAEKRLDEKQKESIYKIYANAFNLLEVYEKEVDILLTNPLYDVHLVKTEENQKECFFSMVQEYSDKDKILIIKPHPADTINYLEIFPDAYIIEPAISAEILNFCPSLKVNRVISLASTAILSFENAKEIIILGTDYLERFGSCMNPSQIRALQGTVEHVKQELKIGE